MKKNIDSVINKYILSEIEETKKTIMENNPEIDCLEIYSTAEHFVCCIELTEVYKSKSGGKMKHTTVNKTFKAKKLKFIIKNVYKYIKDSGRNFV